MRDIEKILKENGKEIENLAIPEDLENRLSKALDHQAPKSKHKGKWYIKVASLLLIFIFVGYNVDTLAYYGKKLIGFDSVMSESLKDLNENGKGQIIDKSFTFDNGIEVTLDGVMVDDNQLLLFYTEKSDNGNIDEFDLSSTSLKGFFKELQLQSGTGEINEEKTEMKWVMSFEPPSFFQKNLTWEFYNTADGKTEYGKISFTLDRNKAMGYTLKSNINKKVKFDNREITFDSIVASQTTTIIKGTIQNTLGLFKDKISGERMMPEGLNFDLLANGETLQSQSGGMSTNINGIKFHKEFQPLPEDLEQLQIRITAFVADYEVDEKIKITKGKYEQGINGKEIHIKEQQIKINEVYEKEGDTFITITTEDHILLSKVYLMVDGIKTELDNTEPYSMDKSENGNVSYTRTLCFKGTGEELELSIKRITFNKKMDVVIELPI